MHVRDDLGRPRSVVLHDVVVGHASGESDCAGEEGEVEACAWVVVRLGWVG